jgi:hypothetical protein
MQIGSDPAGMSQTRKLRRIGCALLLFLVLCFSGVILITHSETKSAFLRADKQAVQRVEAMGYAASMNRYAQKYPSTEQGRNKLGQVAGVLASFNFDYKRYETSTESTVTKLRSNLDLQGMVTRASGITLTTAALISYANSNTTAIQQLLQLSEVGGSAEVGWTYSSLDDPSPLANTSWSQLRDVTRVLLPTAICLSLDDNNTTRAYDLLLNWVYLARSESVASTNLVHGMIASALYGLIMSFTKELMAIAPPDVNTLRRLHEQLSPERMASEFFRSVEIDNIGSIELLRIAAGVGTSIPAPLAKSSRDFNSVVLGGFGLTFRACMADIIHLKKPSTWPWVRLLPMAFGPTARRHFSEAFDIYLDLPRRSREILDAPDSKSANSAADKTADWIDSRVQHNPIFLAYEIPSFTRAAMSIRRRQAEAAVLQTACLIEMLKTEDRGTSEGMPRNIEELARRASQPLPIDPLASRPGAYVTYKPDFITGHYIVEHAPLSGTYGKGVSDVFRFEGTW